MSEVQRKQKDGINRDKKNQRMEEQTPDARQNRDQPDVHQEKAPKDEFDKTLEKDSKQTKRGAGNQAK